DGDAALGAGVEQSLANRIFANDVHRDLQAVCDELPAPAAVVRAVDVRFEIVEAMAIDGGVRRLRIEVRGLDDADLRPWRERGRRDVRPVRSLVARAPDQSIIGSGPEVVLCDSR